jgi:hypothetical protein
MATPHLSNKDYTIAWVCSFSYEFRAAERLFDEVHKTIPLDLEKPGDYLLGRIGGYNVVITYLPEDVGTDKILATEAASRMKSDFPSIKFTLIVGIGGAMPSDTDIDIGDVVVGKPDWTGGGVIQYFFEEHPEEDPEKPGEDIKLGRTTKGETLKGPSMELELMLECFRANLEKETRNYMSFIGKKSWAGYFRSRPEVHYGKIALGNVTIYGFRDQRTQVLGKIDALEAGTAALTDYYPCLVVRGICDGNAYPRNNVDKLYAADTSAAWAKAFLVFIFTQKPWSA